MSPMAENERDPHSVSHNPQNWTTRESGPPQSAVRVHAQEEQFGSPQTNPTPSRQDGDAPRQREALRPRAEAGLPGPAPRRAAIELAATLAAVPADEPQEWWRRWLNLGPKPEDVVESQIKETLRTSFADPLVVAVVSPKGSAGKTPTARGIGAAMSRQRGGGVVVVDLNELRGTLGQRSVLTHDGHIGNLVEHAGYLLSDAARSAEVERCMNRQPNSFEWVLTSDKATTKPITFEEFDKVLAILKRFFSVIIFDTGNSELSSSWQAATAAADILVVPMKWKGDSMVPATAMLDDLREGGQTVVGRTVLLGTNGVHDSDPVERAEGLATFETHYPELPILEIPVDDALHKGIIRWTRLRSSTRSAYEKVGAELIELAVRSRHA